MIDTPVRTATVLDDPKKMLAPAVPLDRSAVLRVVAAVLDPPTPNSELPPEDCIQIGQLLAGHAILVADDVHRLLDGRPGTSRLRPLTETVLTEARGRLSVPPRPTLPSTQNRCPARACPVRALRPADVHPARLTCPDAVGTPGGARDGTAPTASFPMAPVPGPGRPSLRPLVDRPLRAVGSARGPERSPIPVGGVREHHCREHLAQQPNSRR
ncbi:hypothetical protein [Streptomyces adelaidensis]|uniref:hypothetical protein n=1 Tax=Streptomyces adelaidensis TaxID=2796465 RepID=UPI001905E5DF|nr:hypothetical protein [Streptomyces adelaidensis]